MVIIHPKQFLYDWMEFRGEFFIISLYLTGIPSSYCFPSDF